MNKKEDFYIGWQDEMAESNRQFLKKRLIPLFLFIPIVVFLLVYFQKPFKAHQFQLGKISTVIGTYYHQPFPVLVADEGSLPDDLSKDILLVGYGKFGAEGTMETIQKAHGNLHGKKISLLGTLIFGDGKTLMELTKGDESLIEVVDKTERPAPLPSALKPILVKGEILDPKCYFGVMKPGEGKIHKSCAIRCISGGIPPVFRHASSQDGKAYEYFLMVDEQGNRINKDILTHVAEPISIQAKATEFLSWKILYLNTQNIKTLE